MKIVGCLSLLVGGSVAGYLLASLGVVDIVDGLPGTQEEPSISLPTYLSFVAVMLTAVTTVLTAVAIGIGVIAAYTFREIKDEAQKVACKTAQEKAEEALADEVIQARIDKIAFAGGSTSSLHELEKGFDPTDDGNR